MEGPYVFGEEEEWDGDESDTVKPFEAFKFESTVGKVQKTRKATARRISVSSSESDVDIKEVLKEVVRDYTATHARSTRPAERLTRTSASVDATTDGG